MQWADLRGLSSSTRRGVARMTTTAARQRLPLLLPPRLPTQRWRNRARIAGEVRPFSAAAGRRTDKPSRTQPRPKPPSLFEELFPDEDPWALSTRGGNGQHQRGAPNPSSKDEGGGKVKVRYLTSTDTGKPDTTEYQQKVLKYKQKPRQAEHHASSAAIVDLLESRARAKKDRPKAAGGESPSLFNELFSNRDLGPVASGGTSGRAEAEQHLSEDRHVNHDDLQSWLDSLPKGDADTAADAATTAMSSTTRPAMLVLSNASPNLQESDFYRIGPQGHHLDGWSSSIRKVMQAYDYSTLEPMNRYFILFDSYAAAESYQKEAQRRHAAARRSLLSATAPLASSSRAVEGGSAPSPSIFTLAPPSRAPLSLHLYKLDRATEARLGTFSVQGLLSMTPEPPPRANSHVILCVDGGTVDQRMLTHWLRRDGRERNLGWPVQHMRPYFAPKVDDRTVAPDEAQEVDDEPGWRDGDGDDDAPPPLVDSEGKRKGGGPDENAMSARFVLSFPDVHEARRFVRAWHRREFVLTNGSTVVLNTYVSSFFTKITCKNNM
ncbi:uncharacterized protein LY79DRAFT_589163 [Colletotrichum navitas]|uniref:Uncharacterized protein n=1 Tax=Colletotrichum navitas TaxID=681940 RepID=A0AAD8Q343_9PEZI|nr:uncharacterized protein LY79DRAFT_589163 [Colletotrichum navitas]KAK1594311.1 hypothetical protein LY79DRAFT_589163 [Colletotrichum navitas]